MTVTVESRPTPRERFSAIHRALRDRICLLIYPPGTALSEAELAREFGVSRTPMRRVMQALENEGLIETTPNVGSMVTSVELKSLRDAYALRMKLAELLGDLNPASMLDAITATLRELLAECQPLSGQVDVRALAQISHRLQDEILHLSGNAEYRQVSEVLYYKTIRAYLEILPELNWAAEVAAQADEITEILASLAAGDIRAVGFIRRNHIARTLNRITSFMLGDHD
ncbi:MULTISPECIES: GntR family transcriptional regulator [Ancylobacter]|uniref:GntR family transcriptional regulator n=1 Tax=Ancylobacter TaxID=99 RepID=UPI0004783D71|nr:MULTISPECIES: GntR family transcriptional regulator [Ancylobacter]